MGTREIGRGAWVMVAALGCGRAAAPTGVVAEEVREEAAAVERSAAEDAVAAVAMEPRITGPVAVVKAVRIAAPAEIVATLPEPWPGAVRWIAAGGGSTPESNQVSIEQDLGLARATFGAGGLLLFAGGRGSHGVQVEDEAHLGDALLVELGALFQPRGGRGAVYRPTELPADAAATTTNLRLAIDRASAAEGEPLLLYLAGHGQRGEQPSEAAIDLWGQTSLQAFELAALLDERPRPVRLVVTTCYSGGFAELAFVDADARRRRPAADRCGLFAATAEREASGCDPNPDRAAQEGYGLHFLNALRGLGRDGEAAAIDLDGDGRVSLLEAHARARGSSAGIDVPTTTSERWLRSVPGLRGRSVAVDLPEEDAVIAALTASLELDGRAAAAGLARLQEDMVETAGRIDQASAAEDAAYRETAAELLARWPVLDDPWHPDFAATLAAGRTAIAARLAASEAYARYHAAQVEGDAAREQLAAAMARSAQLERLVRALETRELAGRLKARGGADWAAYQRLLACERWVPPG